MLNRSKYKYTKEQKRNIHHLEEIITKRMNTPCQGFDEKLLEAQRGLAEIYAKKDDEKATKLLKKAIHEYFLLISQENKKTSKTNLGFYNEEYKNQREVIKKKLNTYEEKLLNAAQKIEKNSEELIRTINFWTNNLKHTEIDYEIENKINKQKINKLDYIVKETKYDGKIRYVNNKDIIDKKMLHIYS